MGSKEGVVDFEISITAENYPQKGVCDSIRIYISIHSKGLPLLLEPTFRLLTCSYIISQQLITFQSHQKRLMCGLFKIFFIPPLPVIFLSQDTQAWHGFNGRTGS